MPRTIAADREPRHRVIPEIAPAMVKADLRKTESEPAETDFAVEIGLCLDYARRFNGWTLDELASQLPPAPGSETRDPRQVQRWIDGKERTQVDVVFAVPQLRAPFVVALAKLAPDCEIETTVRIRRTA